MAQRDNNNNNNNNPVVGEVDDYGTTSGIDEEEKAGFGMYSSGTGTGAYTGGGSYGTHIHQLPTLYPTIIDESEEGRNRGIKEKVIENLPGIGHHTTPTGHQHEQEEDHHEKKKGIIHKIKEKLHHHHH